MLKKKIFDWLMPLLPKNDLSHFVGKLVHVQIPGVLGKKSVEFFAKAYKINMNEAEYPLNHYRSIGELFVRKLKPGARPIGEGIVHPADALISQGNVINKLTLVQAKGKEYTVPDLLRSSHFSLNFEQGLALTYYLCPTDYHRVHSPVDGEIVWSCHVPGSMWPVNEWSVNRIDHLFAINERVVLVLQTPKGKVALVMVAATNVGNMSFAFDESLNSQFRKPGRSVKERTYHPGIQIKKGEELGVFHMGSTVIVLFERNLFSDQEKEQIQKAWLGKHVDMGQSLI